MSNTIEGQILSIVRGARTDRTDRGYEREPLRAILDVMAAFAGAWATEDSDPRRWAQIITLGKLRGLVEAVLRGDMELRDEGAQRAILAEVALLEAACSDVVDAALLAAVAEAAVVLGAEWMREELEETAARHDVVEAAFRLAALKFECGLMAYAARHSDRGVLAKALEGLRELADGEARSAA